MDTSTVETTADVEDRAAAEPAGPSPEVVDDELVDDELLVEEISIDGMCGVY